jgi:hypothetical protein
MVWNFGGLAGEAVGKRGRKAVWRAEVAAIVPLPGAIAPPEKPLDHPTAPR